MRFSTKLVLGVCSLVLFTGGIITWLAHRSAQESTSKLATALLQDVSGNVVATRVRPWFRPKMYPARR